MSWFDIVKVEVNVGESDAYSWAISQLMMEYFDMRGLKYRQDAPEVFLQDVDRSKQKEWFIQDIEGMNDELNNIIFRHLPESPTFTLTLSKEMIAAFDEILERYKQQEDE